LAQAILTSTYSDKRIFKEVIDRHNFYNPKIRSYADIRVPDEPEEPSYRTIEYLIEELSDPYYILENGFLSHFLLHTEYCLKVQKYYFTEFFLEDVVELASEVTETDFSSWGESDNLAPNIKNNRITIGKAR
jgi:hypothetical protein